MKPELAMISTLVISLSLAQGHAQQWPTPVAFSWPIDTHERCVVEFRDFGWICGLLPKTDDYLKVFGHEFWESARVRVAHGDLDGDALEDVVFVIHHTGHCGSAGCAYYFVFGGHPIPERLQFYGIHSRQDPALIERGGERGIVFSPESMFWPISKIKQEALYRIEFWKHRCSVIDC